MRQIDRFLRTIYKDFPLFEIFDHNYKSSVPSYKFASVASIKWRSAFDLKDEGYRHEVKKVYQRIYSDYNEDELDNLIVEYSEKISKYSPTKYKHNTLNLFLYIAKELVFYQANSLTISFDSLLEWNGIINKIDANIIFAMKAAIEGHEISAGDAHRIQHDNYRLNRILSEGISENHMHLKGSGYTSELNWYDFSTDTCFEGQKSKKFFGILKNNIRHYENEKLAFLKVRIIKFYLFAQIFDHRFEDSEFKKLFKKALQSDDLDYFELLFSKLKPQIEIFKEYWEKEFSPFDHSPRKEFLIERSFLKRLFSKYLRCELSDFDLYLLNIYLLALNKFKMIFYQDNEGMGFEKFKHSENIKEELLGGKDLNKRIYRNVFDKYYSEKNVKQIEFRIAPKTSVKEYYKIIRDLKNVNDDFKKKNKDNAIEFGLVIHYIKNKDDFDLSEGTSRKEKSYFDLRRKAEILISFFEHKPLDDEEKIHQKIVGIDTANYELNVRPEIFGPSFRWQRKEIGEKNPFGITYHAGEDFTTIANGLRAMDEVIEFLDYRRGDRFGHGLALGLDIDKYFKKKRKSVISNVEEYIDDSVWMYYLIEEHQTENEVKQFLATNEISSHAILSFLQGEFDREVVKYNFNDSISMYDFYCAYMLRGDDPELYIEEVKNKSYDKLVQDFDYRLNYHNKKHRQAFENSRARNLYFQYHYSEKYKKMHKESVLLEASEIYIEAVKLVQFILRLKIFRKEISIESNPTSNRKISFISKYIDLPLIELNSMFIKSDSKFNLPISINTDDSAIFQTDLSLEYAYVVAALLREGYDIESVYQYIEYLVKMSKIQSFINRD